MGLEKYFREIAPKLRNGELNICSPRDTSKKHMVIKRVEFEVVDGKVHLVVLPTWVAWLNTNVDKGKYVVSDEMKVPYYINLNQNLIILTQSATCLIFVVEPTQEQFSFYTNDGESINPEDIEGLEGIRLYSKNDKYIQS